MLLSHTRLVFLENSTAISLLESCATVRQALQVHAQIILNGLHHHIFPLSRLISFFALSEVGGLQHSHRLFSQIGRPNCFIWNTMIRGYSRSETPVASIVIYKSMIEQGFVTPNNFTFPFLLNSCARLSNAECGHQIHAHVVKYMFGSDLFINNSLIHCYCSFGELGQAQQLFDESLERDLVSFNTVITGFVRGNKYKEALHLFHEMRASVIKPDEFTFVALLSACSGLNDSNTGKMIHLLICKTFGVASSNLLLKNSLVNMYAKCGLMKVAHQVFNGMGAGKSTMAWSSLILGYAKCGEIEVARQLFNGMPERDVVSWTTMINGYSQIGRYKEALELYKEMEGLGLTPDEVTMVAVLSACGHLGALALGRKTHQYIEDRSFTSNPILDTAIVDMYSKCGAIETAVDVFSRVPDKSKSISIFNSLISGLAQHGLGQRAMEVFTQMEPAGLSPDEITFVGLLCACSHGGLIEEGKKLFSTMTKDYRIQPQIEHFGCMVDLLGRCGHLKEAYTFIEKMPTGANMVIWGALLSACRIHGDIEMAKVVGRRLLELDPDHGARYILLSNMFATANHWEDVAKVRKQMEDRAIQKPAGWSSIELNAAVHQFLASDISGPLAKEINLMVVEMSRRLRSVGYSPDTTHVSFDIDDEEKEEVVSHHSEKLALAFGLIKSEPEATIRIVKNLRICVDCHSSFKLYSEIYRREIVVRDRIRFHHFKDGSCSCRDYW